MVLSVQFHFCVCFLGFSGVCVCAPHQPASPPHLSRICLVSPFPVSSVFFKPIKPSPLSLSLVFTCVSLPPSTCAPVPSPSLVWVEIKFSLCRVMWNKNLVPWSSCLLSTFSAVGVTHSGSFGTCFNIKSVIFSGENQWCCIQKQYLLVAFKSGAPAAHRKSHCVSCRTQVDQTWGPPAVLLPTSRRCCCCGNNKMHFTHPNAFSTEDVECW